MNPFTDVEFRLRRKRLVLKSQRDLPKGAAPKFRRTPVCSRTIIGLWCRSGSLEKKGQSRLLLHSAHLASKKVRKSSQTMGHLTDLSDRPADRLRRPIQVQDQPVPEAIGRLQAIRPLGNHAGLVIDPLHRGTGLTRIEVVQDRRPPAVVGREESTEVQAQVLGLPAELPQPPRGCDPIGSRVEDLLEPQPDLIHLLQGREFLEQRLQRLPLLSGQTLGGAAEFPHPAAEGLAFLLVQLRLVLAGEFFRRVSTASLNFLATWNRSVTARLFFSRAAHAAG